MNKLLTNYNFLLKERKYLKSEELSEKEKRLIFLVDSTLNFTTYCEDYSLRIGEIILDIMKHINFSPESKYGYAREQGEFDYVQFIKLGNKYL